MVPGREAKTRRQEGVGRGPEYGLLRCPLPICAPPTCSHPPSDTRPDTCRWARRKGGPRSALSPAAPVEREWIAVKKGKAAQIQGGKGCKPAVAALLDAAEGLAKEERDHVVLRDGHELAFKRLVMLLGEVQLRQLEAVHANRRHVVRPCRPALALAPQQEEHNKVPSKPGANLALSS